MAHSQSRSVKTKPIGRYGQKRVQVKVHRSDGYDVWRTYLQLERRKTDHRPRCGKFDGAEHPVLNGHRSHAI